MGSRHYLVRLPSQLVTNGRFQQIMAISKDALVREILGRIAEKWALVILTELRHGPHPFSVLQKKIPDISQKEMIG